jgi:hypothetical protein
MENNNGSTDKMESNPLTTEKLREYRKLAKSHEGNVSAKIINHLLDHLQILRDENIKLRLAAVDKWAAYDENTPFPYGEHKGDRIGDVPESYLRWWYNANRDRSAIIVEMDFGPWFMRKSAAKKLKLYDYLKTKFNGHTNGEQIQSDRQGNADADDHYQD